MAEALRPSKRGGTAALVSPRFLSYGVPNRLLFLPKAPHRHDELVLLTFRRQQSAGTSDGYGYFVATLAGVEELLRSTSGFKNVRRSFLVLPSSFSSCQFAPKGGGNSSSTIT
jgi:hypothetical protein